MSILTIRTQMQSDFNTAWASATPIAWDNVDYHSDGTEFVRFSVQFNEGEQASLGGTNNRRFRFYGLVFVQIFTPLNENAQRADELAQLVIDHFVDSNPTGISFRNPSVIHVGASGNFYQQNVAVEFLADEQK